MRYFSFLLLLSGINLTSVAQDSTKSNKLAAIRKLDFLIGKWEGSGWYKMEEKDSLTITQDIVRLNNGEGINFEVFFDMPAKNFSSTTVVDISYDEMQHKYTGTAQAGDGPKIAVEPVLLNDNSFRYSFTLANYMQIHYTFSVANGVHTVTGEYSNDGKT